LLLRRIAQHVKEQNWFAVGLDFLIVVFGVYFGLQVSSWNEVRQDRIEEADFLAQLHNDLMLAAKQSARTEAIRFSQAETVESAVELIFSRASARNLSIAECNAIAYSHTTYVGRA